MSIRTLKTFLAVAKYGSFAAAAKEIGLTQAAISLQMRRLEDELRMRLFDRSRRSVILNTTARNLVSRVSEVVTLYDTLALAPESGGMGGTLSIGAIPPTFSKMLPDALLRLRRRHPRIEVRVINGRSDELAAKVEKGELDAALVSPPPQGLPKRLAWHLILKEPLVLIANRKTRISTVRDTLSREPFIRVTRRSWTGQLIDQVLRHARLSVKDIMELDSIDVIAKMVSKGLGVSIVPACDGAWQRDPALRMWLIDKPRIEREVGMVEREKHSKLLMTGAFLECLTSQPGTARHTVSAASTITL